MARRTDAGQPFTSWTFLTNHAHVLMRIAETPDITIRAMALEVGITERATQLIIRDLVDHGYLVRERRGRRNVYRIAYDLPLRHPLERARSVGGLLAFLADSVNAPQPDGSAPPRQPKKTPTFDGRADQALADTPRRARTRA